MSENNKTICDGDCKGCDGCGLEEYDVFSDPEFIADCQYCEPEVTDIYSEEEIYRGINIVDLVK